MAAMLKVWRKSKIRLCHSRRIYVKNIRVKFHRDPIWNVGDLSVFEGRPNNNKKTNNNKTQDKMSSDIRSKNTLQSLVTKLWKFVV